MRRINAWFRPSSNSTGSTFRFDGLGPLNGRRWRSLPLQAREQASRRVWSCSRIRPSWTPQGQLRCGAIDDERNRSAAVRSLVLGAAGNIDFGVPDKSRERSTDEGARVARGGDVGIVQHGMAVSPPLSLVAGPRPAGQGNEAAPVRPRAPPRAIATPAALDRGAPAPP